MLSCMESACYAVFACAATSSGRWPLGGGLEGAWVDVAVLMQGGAGGGWQCKITAGMLLLLLLLSATLWQLHGVVSCGRAV